MLRMRPALLALAPALLLVGCGQSADTGSGTALQVAASDTSCRLSATTVPAGQVDLTVTNEGAETTEVYVYAADKSVVGEVEDITPGLTRDFSVTLQAGTYEVACKPGERDPGFRATLQAK